MCICCFYPSKLTFVLSLTLLFKFPFYPPPPICCFTPLSFTKFFCFSLPGLCFGLLFLFNSCVFPNAWQTEVILGGLLHYFPFLLHVLYLYANSPFDAPQPPSNLGLRVTRQGCAIPWLKNVIEKNASNQWRLKVHAFVLAARVPVGEGDEYRIPVFFFFFFFFFLSAGFQWDGLIECRIPVWVGGF